MFDFWYKNDYDWLSFLHTRAYNGDDAKANDAYSCRRALWEVSKDLEMRLWPFRKTERRVGAYKWTTWVYQYVAFNIAYPLNVEKAVILSGSGVVHGNCVIYAYDTDDKYANQYAQGGWSFYLFPFLPSCYMVTTWNNGTFCSFTILERHTILAKPVRSTTR